MALRNIWSFAATVTILVMAPGFALSQLASIDNVIAEATNSSEFYYDLGPKDVRVELDMVFSDDQWNEIQSAGSGISKRKAIKPGPMGKRWTDGVIPFDFAPFTFYQFQMQEIIAAMNDWQRYSCLTFRQATNADMNKIVFKNGGGCLSRVGMSGGVQEVGLAPGCRVKRIVIHELGHALGLHHEQTRPDRDGYVRIIDGNIKPGMEFNFDRHSWDVIQDYEVPYDYFSIMHYGKTAFSVNNRITMQTTDPRYQDVIGTQPGLSFWDIKIINLMYPCVSGCNKTAIDCPSVGFLGKDCLCWCPGAPYKVCDGTETENPGPGGGVLPCGDSDLNCPIWAGAGHCVNPLFTDYMSANCRLSCHLCGGGGVPSPSVCQNVDTSGHCDVWAQTGLCQRVPDFMLAQCRRSCNACDAAPTSPSPSSSSSPPPPPASSSTISPVPPSPSSLPSSSPSSLPSSSPSSLLSSPSSLPSLPSSSSLASMDQNANYLFWAQVENMCVTNPYFTNVCCPLLCGRPTATYAAPANSWPMYYSTQYGNAYGRKRKL